jgi:hypothetical protein
VNRVDILASQLNMQLAAVHRSKTIRDGPDLERLKISGNITVKFKNALRILPFSKQQHEPWEKLVECNLYSAIS